MSKTFEEITRPDNGPLVELNNNMQEVFSQYRKNGKSIEPIITQQALPVVPEFVAEWIKFCRKNKKNSATLYTTCFCVTFSWKDLEMMIVG